MLNNLSLTSHKSHRTLFIEHLQPRFSFPVKQYNRRLNSIRNHIRIWSVPNSRTKGEKINSCRSKWRRIHYGSHRVPPDSSPLGRLSSNQCSWRKENRTLQELVGLGGGQAVLRSIQLFKPSWEKRDLPCWKRSHLFAARVCSLTDLFWKSLSTTTTENMICGGYYAWLAQKQNRLINILKFYVLTHRVSINY